MKAILILDEMPIACWECPCMNKEKCWRCNANNANDDGRLSFADGIEKRPDWCPLREMPEKRILPKSQVDYTNYGEEPWFSDGWNACLEEIEK